MNNNGYGLIKQTQDTWLNSRRVGVDEGSGLAMPNLTKVARAYGIKTCEINNHNEMGANLKNILKSKHQIVCDVKVNEKQRVIPKLEFGRSIEDMSPRLSTPEMSLNIVDD